MSTCRLALVPLAIASACVVAVGDGAGDFGGPHLGPSGTTTGLATSSSSSEEGSTAMPVPETPPDVGDESTTAPLVDSTGIVDTTTSTGETLSCGDGMISDGEECEPPLNESCRSLDLGHGMLGCTDDCRYDIDDCRCRGLGEHCNAAYNGESNCCPPGFKGNVTGICDEPSERCA